VPRTIVVEDDEFEAPQGGAAANGVPMTGPGLRVSGLLVTKADLIAALQTYVPGLVDIAVTEDGERFVLMLGPRLEVTS
jgi:hypothetical protein